MLVGIPELRLLETGTFLFGDALQQKTLITGFSHMVAVDSSFFNVLGHRGVLPTTWIFGCSSIIVESSFLTVLGHRSVLRTTWLFGSGSDVDSSLTVGAVQSVFLLL